ncbi:hypothetical protein ACZ91_18755 [Streptomyces regensis]|nr:hypothetical protein ACZ91_18755 [Streptomyces regensis]
MTVSLTLVASTCATARCSSQYRTRLTCPYASSAVTHANGTFASKARWSMAWKCSIFVANGTSSGTPAARHRSRSSVQGFGRYNSRSINARPRREA